MLLKDNIQRLFVDSFRIRFIPQTSTKISDIYEGLTEGRKSRTRWDVKEDFDGNSISILWHRSISETTEDEGSGRVPTKFDPS